MSEHCYILGALYKHIYRINYGQAVGRTTETPHPTLENVITNTAGVLLLALGNQVINSIL